LAQDVVIGSVARLDVGKGHQELLAALAQLTSRFPHAKLLCVGDGPMRRRLETRIRQLGLTDCVQLLGQRDDVPQLTQAFDIAVLASRYEGMGRVLLEAQAAGKPVVAMNAGGMVDIVKDGQTGYLVPVGDARAFAEALERLITDAALRARMGQAAVEWVSSRFSQQRMCEQLNTLYDRLLRPRERC
jgi:glycosyltransferase involved in cell wall biosynthesis